MPIILENSHSHSFSFVDEDGVTRNVEVARGQDIEPLNIPRKTLSKLMSEFVVGFDGNSERPRYKYVEDLPEEQGSYSTGPISQALVTKSFRKSDEVDDGNRLTPEELTALQRKAEAEMKAEAEAQLGEETQLKAAEAERVAREKAEGEARIAAAEARTAELEAQLKAAQDAAKPAETAKPAVKPVAKNK